MSYIQKLDKIVACPDTFLAYGPRIAFEKDQVIGEKDANWPQNSQLTTGEFTAASYLESILPENDDRFYQVGSQATSVGNYKFESDVEDIEDLVAPNMSRRIRSRFDMPSVMRENDLEAFLSKTSILSGNFPCQLSPTIGYMSNNPDMQGTSFLQVP